MTLFGSIDRKEKFVPTLKTFYEMTALTTFDEVAACEMDMEFSDFVKENVKLDVLDQAWLEWKDFNVHATHQNFTHTHTNIIWLINPYSKI